MGTQSSALWHGDLFLFLLFLKRLPNACIVEANGSLKNEKNLDILFGINPKETFLTYHLLNYTPQKTANKLCFYSLEKL